MPGPLRMGSLWLEWINKPQSEAELAALRRCVARGCPYGSQQWTKETAALLGSEHTLGRVGIRHR